MKKIIFRILIIISILIIVFGIFSIIDIKNKSSRSTEKQYLDGTDVTIFTDFFLMLGSSVLIFYVIMYSICILSGIWIVYGLIYLIIKIINEHKKRKITK